MSDQLDAQYVKECSAYYYLLAPGDATPYSFSIVHILRLGVGVLGDVQVNIEMPATQISLTLPAHMWTTLSPARVRYIRGKAASADPYTLIAILLAVEVLVKEPLNITGAAQAMDADIINRLMDEAGL